MAREASREDKAGRNDRCSSIEEQLDASVFIFLSALFPGRRAILFHSVTTRRLIDTNDKEELRAQRLELI